MNPPTEKQLTGRWLLREMRQPAQQGGRYLLIGGVGWVVDFLTYIAVLGLVGVFWAQTAARVSGAIVTFVGHKFFVFRDRPAGAARLARQTLQYAALWVLSYLLSLGGILYLVEYQQVHPVVAKILVEIVVVLLNFFTMKRFIFAAESGRA